MQDRCVSNYCFCTDNTTSIDPSSYSDTGFSIAENLGHESHDEQCSPNGADNWFTVVSMFTKGAPLNFN